MHVLFVDESGTPPPPNRTCETPFFVLGGVAVPEDQWRKLASDLAAIKASFKIIGEIKWRHFAGQKPGSKPTPLSHLSIEDKEKVRSRVYAALTAYKSIKLIAVVCDTERAYGLPYVSSADEMYWYAYKQLTERFQYYMQDLERTVGANQNGIIVCDHRAPKDDQRLRDLHHRMIHSSKPNVSKYSNLVEGLFIAPSHQSVGIQFADMVAGAVYRKHAKGDDRFFNQIVASFRISPKGEINGFGIVHFPKP